MKKKTHKKTLIKHKGTQKNADEIKKSHNKNGILYIDN